MSLGGCLRDEHVMQLKSKTIKLDIIIKYSNSEDNNGKKLFLNIFHKLKFRVTWTFELLNNEIKLDSDTYFHHLASVSVCRLDEL